MSDYGFFLVSRRPASASASSDGFKWRSVERASIPFHFLLQRLSVSFDRPFATITCWMHQAATSIHNFYCPIDCEHRLLSLPYIISVHSFFTSWNLQLLRLHQRCCCYDIHIVNRGNIEDATTVERFLCWYFAWHCYSQEPLNMETLGRTYLGAEEFSGNCSWKFVLLSLKLLHREK